MGCIKLCSRPECTVDAPTKNLTLPNRGDRFQEWSMQGRCFACCCLKYFSKNAKRHALLASGCSLCQGSHDTLTLQARSMKKTFQLLGCINGKQPAYSKKTNWAQCTMYQ